MGTAPAWSAGDRFRPTTLMLQRTMKIIVRMSVGSYRNATGLPYVAMLEDQTMAGFGGRRSLAVERLLHQLEDSGRLPEKITIENLEMGQ